MCGIGGYIGRSVGGLEDRLADAIARRGPDGRGVFVEEPVHLVNTRLAIVDIDGGAQPFEAPGTHAVVVYNGEIYNYSDLRARLEQAGWRCRTHCDTELIPLGYRAFGTEFFSWLNGMFAFALYDRLSGELHLARDPIGIKPLHIARISGGLVFGSSALAVVQHPEVDSGLDADAVRDFLQFRYVPGGKALHRGVEPFPPNTIGTWRDGHFSMRPLGGPAPPTAPQTDAEWEDALAALLRESVALELRADVPVGVFLSGGVDSAVVATLAAAASERPLKAFTYAIPGKDDETERARRIAERSGLRHVVVSGSGGLEDLRSAVVDMDLPVGDAIILPTWRLCREAAREVKCVLTGEGADELFGGYVHIGVLRRLDRLAVVRPLAPALSAAAGLAPVALLDRFFHYQASLGRMGRRKVARLVAALGRPEAMYREACSVLADAELCQATHLAPATIPEAGGADGRARLSLAGLLDDGLTHWLPYQILNKMDSLSMAHGLEARVPYLDPRVRALLAQAPERLVLGDQGNKTLLRRVARRLGLPEALRPKLAFHLPVEVTHRRELVALARTWLAPDRVSAHGILRRPYVETLIGQVEAGEFLASKQIVTMICLHMWLDRWGAPR